MNTNLRHSSEFTARLATHEDVSSVVAGLNFKDIQAPFWNMEYPTVKVKMKKKKFFFNLKEQ